MEPLYNDQLPQPPWLTEGTSVQVMLVTYPEKTLLARDLPWEDDSEREAGCVRLRWRGECVHCHHDTIGSPCLWLTLRRCFRIRGWLWMTEMKRRVRPLSSWYWRLTLPVTYPQKMLQNERLVVYDWDEEESVHCHHDTGGSPCPWLTLRRCCRTRGWLCTTGMKRRVHPLSSWYWRLTLPVTYPEKMLQNERLVVYDWDEEESASTVIMILTAHLARDLPWEDASEREAGCVQLRWRWECVHCHHDTGGSPCLWLTLRRCFRTRGWLCTTEMKMRVRPLSSWYWRLTLPVNYPEKMLQNERLVVYDWDEDESTSTVIMILAAHLACDLPWEDASEREAGCVRLRWRWEYVHCHHDTDGSPCPWLTLRRCFRTRGWLCTTEMKMRVRPLSSWYWRLTLPVTYPEKMLQNERLVVYDWDEDESASTVIMILAAHLACDLPWEDASEREAGCVRLRWRGECVHCHHGTGGSQCPWLTLRRCFRTRGWLWTTEMKRRVRPLSSWYWRFTLPVSSRYVTTSTNPFLPQNANYVRMHICAVYTPNTCPFYNSNPIASVIGMVDCCTI